MLASRDQRVRPRKKTEAKKEKGEKELEEIARLERLVTELVLRKSTAQP